MNRHGFIRWLSFFMGLSCLLNVSFAATDANEPHKDEMEHLYQIFERSSQDLHFIANFEKYQAENNCCGIFGPDDWLMAQLRIGQIKFSGGYGFQSMDYGFTPDKNAGKCHITHPVLQGCGSKSLAGVQKMLMSSSNGLHLGHFGLIILVIITQRIL